MDTEGKVSREPCPTCKGTGTHTMWRCTHACRRCHGTGRLPVVVPVAVPAGDA